MFKKYFLLLLLGHVLGDFYTQTPKMAKQKETELKIVLQHSLVYLLTMLAVSVPFMSKEIFVMDVLMAFSHMIIDLAKYFYLIKMKKKDLKRIFIMDQFLHVFCLIMIAYVWTTAEIQITELGLISDFFDTVGLSELFVGTWLLGILIVHKPANIFIQNMIGNYKPKAEDGNFKPDNNIGRVIGSVERIIMLVLMYMNQYSAMGLVLTAKSIARYDKIAKEAQFAEYYLLGTLISAGIVIGCAVVLF